MSIYDQIAQGTGGQLTQGAMNRYTMQRQQAIDQQAKEQADRAYGLQQDTLNFKTGEANRKAEIEAAKRKLEAATRMAAHLLNVPEDQRQSLYEKQKPLAQSAGIDISAFPDTVPSEDVLRAFVAQGLSAEKQLMTEIRDLGTGEPGVTQPTAIGKYDVTRQVPIGPPKRASEKPLVSLDMGPKLSPGRKAVDETFAKKVYVPWVTEGGYGDAQKQLGQLRDALVALQDPTKSLTGPVIGMSPDLALTMLNPDAVNVREKVEEVVQRNLRSILGAQFTEKEGERLIKRAYNPSLSPETNAKRLESLIQQMLDAAEAKQKSVTYFEENGTLRGFKGKKYNWGDFYSVLPPVKGGKKSAAELSDEDIKRELGL